MPPMPPTFPTTTGQIIRINTAGNNFLIGNPLNVNRQTQFNVNARTVITDSRGNRIPLSRLRLGQRVRVTHADFQTMSIPPQTTAYRVQVL